MAWQDRIKEAAYITPSGERFTFDYENVSRTVSRKTSAFNFPDAEGTYIQDLGHTGRRYPFRVIFWGEDYDQLADAFESALNERGVGRLEHPIYGVVDVVPFGDIERRDNLKTAANQAIISVQFWETVGLLYPTGQAEPGDAVLQAVDEYNESAAEQFEGTIDLDTATERAVFKNRYQLLLDTTNITLRDVAAAQDDVKNQFNAVYDSINNGLNVLVGEPLTLALQTAILLESPARAAVSIQARLDAYSGLIDQFTDTVHTPGLNSEAKNAFLTEELYATTSVIAAALAVVNNIFETKTDALAAADSILTLSDQVIAWRDSNFDALSEIDTGGAYQKFLDTVALTAGFLVEISFNLKQERRVTLDRNRTMIDLVAELYGKVDEELDFFINSNELTGSEILELEKGRQIVYFV
jgi:prophage DNA circulation protein